MTALGRLLTRVRRRTWLERGADRLRWAGGLAAVLLLLAGLLDLLFPLPDSVLLASALLPLPAALLVALLRDRPPPAECARLADARFAGDDLLLSALALQYGTRNAACAPLVAARAETCAAAALARRWPQRTWRLAPWLPLAALTGGFLLALPEPAPPPAEHRVAAADRPRPGLREPAAEPDPAPREIAEQHQPPATREAAALPVSPRPEAPGADADGTPPGARTAMPGAASPANPQPGSVPAAADRGLAAGDAPRTRSGEDVARARAIRERAIVLTGDGSQADQASGALGSATTAPPAGTAPAAAIPAARWSTLAPHGDPGPAARGYLARYFELTGEPR